MIPYQSPFSLTVSTPFITPSDNLQTIKFKLFFFICQAEKFISIFQEILFPVVIFIPRSKILKFLHCLLTLPQSFSRVELLHLKLPVSLLKSRQMLLTPVYFSDQESYKPFEKCFTGSN